MALDIGVFLDTIKNLFKSKVSSNDAQPDYLINKFTSSDASVTITETNDGGVEQINLQSAGGSDTNFATDDLTLTGNRTHDISGNDLVFTGVTNTNGVAFGSGDVGIEDLLIIPRSSTNTYHDITNQVSQISLSNTNDILINSISSNIRTAINTTSSVSGVSLLVKGHGTSSSTAPIIARNSSNTELFKVRDNGQVTINNPTPTAQFTVKGSGSTSATTTALFENSSGTDSLEVRDDNVIIMANLPTSSAGLPTGALWNNSGVINIV